MYRFYEPVESSRLGRFKYSPRVFSLANYHWHYPAFSRRTDILRLVSFSQRRWIYRYESTCDCIKSRASTINGTVVGEGRQIVRCSHIARHALPTPRDPSLFFNVDIQISASSTLSFLTRDHTTSSFYHLFVRQFTVTKVLAHVSLLPPPCSSCNLPTVRSLFFSSASPSPRCSVLYPRHNRRRDRSVDSPLPLCWTSHRLPSIHDRVQRRSGTQTWQVPVTRMSIGEESPCHGPLNATAAGI